jgi:D-sedoheptulose 7-phosphate isomerase
VDYLLDLITRYPKLETQKNAINNAFEILKQAFENGGKLLLAGNGGSAADCEHIAGELMKRFYKARPLNNEFLGRLEALYKTGKIDASKYQYIAKNLQGALPAISLTTHSALASACINDIDGNCVYAQEVYGWGGPEDVFLGISTSGNAKNVVYAAIAAKSRGMSVIALSGGTGGDLRGLADAAIVVGETETYKVQELHLPIYHALCLMLEDYFF